MTIVLHFLKQTEMYETYYNIKKNKVIYRRNSSIINHSTTLIRLSLPNTSPISLLFELLQFNYLPIYISHLPSI